MSVTSWNTLIFHYSYIFLKISELIFTKSLVKCNHFLHLSTICWFRQLHVDLGDSSCAVCSHIWNFTTWSNYTSQCPGFAFLRSFLFGFTRYAYKKKIFCIHKQFSAPVSMGIECAGSHIRVYKWNKKRSSSDSCVK